MHHSAIHISNKHNKLTLIQQIMDGHFFADLELLKGELYSEIALNQFIDEEIRHEHFDVINAPKNSLQQYSDGEKKKALLAYIIAKKPDYIIIDNIFDNLDANAQSAIVNTLADLSKYTIIIQIANRKNDILSFINDIYFLQENKLVLKQENDEFLHQPDPLFLDAIPPPYHTHVFEKDTLVKFNNVTIKYEDRL